MDKEERLQKRLSELIKASGTNRTRIFQLMRRNGLKTIKEFMSIETPYEGMYKRGSALDCRNIGRKAFERIEEIQEILAKEGIDFHCEFCRLYDLRKKALASDDIDFIKRAVEEFSLLWLNVDEELSYHMCLLDGSWPGADKILLRALEKFKNHPNREEE